jgi:hypothetical protein
MSQNTKPIPARRLQSTPPLVGHVHKHHFDDKGASTTPITAADEAILRDTFPGVEFSAIEEKPATETK